MVVVGSIVPAAADPRKDYMLNCQGCHGPDGAGAPGAAPSFRGQVARFLSVKDGREYLVRVPGTAQSALDDARTAALLNWLLQTFDPEHVPANFRPFRADEVKALRQAPLTDVVSVRRQLVQALDGR
jgi:mono/diheme cytochrome c family protein